jgi:hypothetical protein
MTTTFTEVLPLTTSIQERLDSDIDNALNWLSPVGEISAPERRGIIARYSAVLEGNFIYWMTGAYLSAKTEEARSIILENLHEEVRDCHPGMLRKFEMAADAVPTDADAFAVYPEMSAVRLFIGRLSPIRIIVMMAFFEGFIQRFMPYLATLAQLRGSTEQEYTDVHGICDVAHTQELYHALEAELAVANTIDEQPGLFEGVELLQTLIRRIVTG